SDSNALSRQPSVTTRTPHAAPVSSTHSEEEWGEGADSRNVELSFIAGSGRREGIEHAVMLHLDRSSHPDAIVGAPLDFERTTGQRDCHAAIGEPPPHRTYGRGAGGAAAGSGEAGATLPGAQCDRLPRDHVSERDVGPLREDRMVLEQRPDPGYVEGGHVIYPEHGMRVADVGDGGGV